MFLVKNQYKSKRTFNFSHRFFKTGMFYLIQFLVSLVFENSRLHCRDSNQKISLFWKVLFSLLSFEQLVFAMRQTNLCVRGINSIYCINNRLKSIYFTIKLTIKRINDHINKYPNANKTKNHEGFARNTYHILYNLIFNLNII